jgi:hypothetical protein
LYENKKVNTDKWISRAKNFVISELHKYNNELYTTVKNIDFLDEDFFKSSKIMINPFTINEVLERVLNATNSFENLKKQYDLIYSPITINNKPSTECEFDFVHLDFWNDIPFTIRLHGFVDLIIKRNDEIIVVDWKTGMSSDNEMQLKFYGFVLSEYFNLKNIKMYYVYSSSQTVNKFDFDKNSKNYVKSKFTNIFDKLITIDYPNIDENVLEYFSKRKTWACKFCTANCQNAENSFIYTKFKNKKIKYNGIVL